MTPVGREMWDTALLHIQVLQWGKAESWEPVGVSHFSGFSSSLALNPGRLRLEGVARGGVALQGCP